MDRPESIWMTTEPWRRSFQRPDFLLRQCSSPAWDVQKNVGVVKALNSVFLMSAQITPRKRLISPGLLLVVRSGVGSRGQACDRPESVIPIFFGRKRADLRRKALKIWSRLLFSENERLDIPRGLWHLSWPGKTHYTQGDAIEHSAAVISVWAGYASTTNPPAVDNYRYRRTVTRGEITPVRSEAGLAHSGAYIACLGVRLSIVAYSCSWPF